MKTVQAFVSDDGSIHKTAEEALRSSRKTIFEDHGYLLRRYYIGGQTVSSFIDNLLDNYPKLMKDLNALDQNNS